MYLLHFCHVVIAAFRDLQTSIMGMLKLSQAACLCWAGAGAPAQAALRC